jgi:hypothetical protein
VCADPTTVATCSEDPQGCFYESGSSVCTNQACVDGQCKTVACAFDSPGSAFDDCVFAP